MRGVVALAMDTGLPVEYWLDQTDPRHLDTAMELREAAAKALEAPARGRR